MQRRIVEPAALGNEALNELKAWLGITRSGEDELLVDLLRSSLATCEAFTGQAPLSQLIEERVPACAGVYTLASRPVASFAVAEIVLQDGIRNLIDPSLYEAEIGVDSHLSFRLMEDLEGQAVAVRLRAGMTAVWDEIPAPLRHGIIRLCAHYYRDRDRPASDRQPASPPASVSALWRPFQQLRLA